MWSAVASIPVLVPVRSVVTVAASVAVHDLVTTTYYVAVNVVPPWAVASTV